MAATYIDLAKQARGAVVENATGEAVLDRVDVPAGHFSKIVTQDVMRKSSQMIDDTLTQLDRYAA